MSDLRISLQEIESKLLSPIILEESTKECVDKLQNEHQVSLHSILTLVIFSFFTMKYLIINQFFF